MIVDAYAQVGGIPMRRAPVGFPELFGEMERMGVSRAAVYGLRGLHADARKGNDQVLAAAAGDARIVPTAVFAPHAGMLDVPALLSDAVSRGAAAVAISITPALSTTTLSFRRTLKQAAATGLPIVACGAVSPGVITALAEATAGMGCRLMFAGAFYGLIDELIAVLEEHAHTYAETSWQLSPGCIEMLVEAAGPDRVLFGSGAPVRPVLPALNMVVNADLGDDVKRRILAGNAVAFYGLDEAEWDSSDAPLPRVELPETPAIDVHNHLGTMPHMSASVRDAQAIEELASAAVMEYSICSSYVAYREDMDAGNRELLDVLAARPKLLGSLVISPTHFEESLRWLDMFDRDDRLAHATLMIDTIRERPGDEGYYKLLAEAAKRRVPIFLNGPSWDHVRLLSWPSGPAISPFEGRSAAKEVLDMLVEVDRRHPELPIIVGHGMGEDGVWLAKRTRSVYLELAGSYPELGAIRRTIDEVGKERVVFGSDLDFIDPAYALGVYAAADMTPDEERAVMAENARRILRLPR